MWNFDHFWPKVQMRHFWGIFNQCADFSNYWIFRETACSLRPSQVAPVGLAFKKYKEKHGLEEFLKLSQMDKNDHHSRLRGSYLSACVHYNMIFGEKCTGNDFLAHHTKAQCLKITINCLNILKFPFKFPFFQNSHFFRTLIFFQIPIFSKFPLFQNSH